MPSDGIEPRPGPRDRWPLLDQWAAVSWRLLVIAAALFVLVWALAQIRIVVLPVVAALLVTTVLSPPARWLERRRFPTPLAAAVVFLGAAAVVAGVVVLTVPPLVDEFGDLGPELTASVDRIEDWLIEGPLELEREQVVDARRQLRDGVASVVSSEENVVSSAVLAGEVVAGLLLAFIITFFLVKDGPRMQRWVLEHSPDDQRPRVARVGRAAWSTLRAYVMGAALLGFVEAVIIGGALAIVGADVVLPVAVLTFTAAFFPFVGAIVAGVIAVLVALVSGGVGDAVAIAVVALAVQQLDNDLLAPLIYGRAFSLHPLVIILTLTAGGAVAGIAGAFLAVPITAVTIRAWTAATRNEEDQLVGPDPGS